MSGRRGKHKVVREGWAPGCAYWPSRDVADPSGEGDGRSWRAECQRIFIWRFTHPQHRSPVPPSAMPRGASGGPSKPPKTINQLRKTAKKRQSHQNPYIVALKHDFSFQSRRQMGCVWWKFPCRFKTPKAIKR